jgi:hypothetical protein
VEVGRRERNDDGAPASQVINAKAASLMVALTLPALTKICTTDGLQCAVALSSPGYNLLAKPIR